MRTGWRPITTGATIVSARMDLDPRTSTRSMKSQCQLVQNITNIAVMRPSIRGEGVAHAELLEGWLSTHRPHPSCHLPACSPREKEKMAKQIADARRLACSSVDPSHLLPPFTVGPLHRHTLLITPAPNTRTPHQAIDVPSIV